MAVHTLGSEKFKNLDFSDLWKDVDVTKISNLVYDFYPEISRVTSKSENKAFSWLYGRIQVEGPGSIAVLYPYRELSRDLLTLRNVSFSQYPFVSIKAFSSEKAEFEGWKDAFTGKVIWKSDTLVLSRDRWVDVTGFIAEFKTHEDDLGI